MQFIRAALVTFSLAVSTSAASVPVKRDGTGCGGSSVSDADWQAAKAKLSAWCDAGNVVPAHGSHSETSGNARWYVCNYNGGTTGCNDGDITITVDSVNYSCGDDATGWDYLSTPNLSYGIATLTDSFC